MKTIMLIMFLISSITNDPIAYNRKVDSRVAANDKMLIEYQEKIIFPKNKKITQVKKQNIEYEEKNIYNPDTIIYKDIKKYIKETMIDIDYDNTSFKDIIDDIRGYPGMNRIIVMWSNIRNDVGVEPEDTITLKISNISIKKALDLILEQISSENIGQIGYSIDDENIIKIKSVTNSYNYIIRTYYIADLMDSLQYQNFGMTNRSYGGMNQSFGRTGQNYGNRTNQNSSRMNQRYDRGY